MHFNDTAIAFADRSDAEIRKAQWLFRLMGSAALVKFGSACLNTALKLGLPINGLVKATVFSQFCGGEAIAECDEAIGRLYRSKIRSMLDFSAEGKDTDEDHDRVMHELMLTIHHAANDHRVPFAVFKFTGLVRFGLLEKLSAHKQLTPDEDKEWIRAKARVTRLCDEAARCHVAIYIDAEESWIQPAIDAVAQELMAQHNQTQAMVHNTVQLYRTDRYAYILEAHQKAKQGGYRLGLKLVRGAYMEKERARALRLGVPSPICADKAATDQNFDAGLSYCIQHQADIDVFVGTHNEESCSLATQLMDQHGLKPDNRHVWFGQLLGMGNNMSYTLAHHGHNVVKYVPYGPVADVMPYLIRRAQENTSVAGQTGRELQLIKREKERRKHDPS